MKKLLGIDIGGTKCAVSIANSLGSDLDIMDREVIPTSGSATDVLSQLIELGNQLADQYGIEKFDAVGISCGGPLNSEQGLILSPPNLPTWDEVPVVKIFKDAFKTAVTLQNDANACALAEWRWGAGKGFKNVIFLTFGTGLGAGLILNNQLYSGTNDMAGEVGHIRLADSGPVGYGKSGSFEGFCSGGGIAQLAKEMVTEQIESGNSPEFCKNLSEVQNLTTKDVGIAAQKGDALALEIFSIVGQKLGTGLAILIDMLNPQRIIIGSIYNRQHEILSPIVTDILKKECLPISLEVCEIVPAGLGESVGDYASFSVALQGLNDNNT